MASKADGLPALPTSASAPALLPAGPTSPQARARTAPHQGPPRTQQAWAGATVGGGSAGARSGFFARSAATDAVSSYMQHAPPSSMHIPWKQLYINVKAGTKTLAERLADRKRDSDMERDDVEVMGSSSAGGGLGGRLRRAWSSGNTKFDTMSPRAVEMLLLTEKVHRSFNPAPLEGPLPRPDIQGSPPPTGSPKASSGKVQKPTAKSSLSVTKGCKLAQLIESGCIGLVRSSYFEDCMLHNRPFSMRQLIPNSFMWRGDEAVNLWWKHGKCFVCIVSYAWLSRDHPDPNQLHLKKLVRILEEYKRIWNMHEVAVILDYCSLWQKNARGDTRTTEQKEQFNLGFREINVAYAHKAVTSVKLTEVPKDEPRKYDDRGWTLMESILIDSKGGDWNRWCFGEFDPESQQWPDSVVFFMQAKASKLRPPLTPQGFIKELEQRRLRLRGREPYDLVLFTNERDNDEVPKRYEEIFMQIIHSTKLAYDNADWSDDEIASLIDVLASCDRLEKLQLNNNRINLEGASRLAKLIPHLPSLKWLGLRGNPLCKDSQATDLLRLVWGKEKKPMRNLIL